MFHELTGDPHDSSAVQSALRLQLRQARLAKKKPTCLRSAYVIGGGCFENCEIATFCLKKVTTSNKGYSC